MNRPPRLTELLAGSGQPDLTAQWDSTDAAAERELLPPGTYRCSVVRGELGKHPKTQTPRYSIAFEVSDGPHAGQTIYHDAWLTPAALPQTKRDLAKLGVVDVSQLEQPVPPGIVCDVVVVVRTSDGGDQRNAVRRFDFVRRDDDAMDDPDFAPAKATAPTGNPRESESGGDAAAEDSTP